MDAFLSFLLFAGLFYVMMRFGCGAHMAHGGHASNGAGGDGESKHVDPVCGKEVSPTQGYGKMHSQTLYRFCSRECLDAFEADPERYINQIAETKS